MLLGYGGKIISVNGKLLRYAAPATVPVVCEPPVSASAQGITVSSANISYALAAAATGANIRYRIQGATAWIIKYNIGSPYQLQGLVADSTYEYQLQTVCPGDISTWSTTYTFKTLEEVVTPQPGVIPAPYRYFQISQIGSDREYIDNSDRDKWTSTDSTTFVHDVNNYKPDSYEWITLNGQRVGQRNMEKLHVGATPDYWFMQPKVNPAEQIYSYQYFIRFPAGYFANIRAGKINGGFKSAGGVGVGTSYEPDNQPDDFISYIMIWRDKGPNGDILTSGQYPWPENAAIGNFAYFKNVPRKNKKFAKNLPWIDPRTGQTFRVFDQEWFCIHEIWKLNDPGQSNGYVRSFIGSPTTTGGQLVEMSNTLQNVQISGNGIPFDSLECAAFQGGGSASAVPTGWGPPVDVQTQYQGWQIWKGAVVPNWQLFDSLGRPIHTDNLNT